MFLENATKRSFTSLSLVDTSAKGFLSDDISGLAKKPLVYFLPAALQMVRPSRCMNIIHPEAIIAVVGS
jgi:hypothetical protein